MEKNTGACTVEENGPAACPKEKLQRIEKKTTECKIKDKGSIDYQKEKVNGGYQIDEDTAAFQRGEKKTAAYESEKWDIAACQTDTDACHKDKKDTTACQIDVKDRDTYQRAEKDCDACQRDEKDPPACQIEKNLSELQGENVTNVTVDRILARTVEKMISPKLLSFNSIINRKLELFKLNPSLLNPIVLILCYVRLNVIVFLV